MLRAISLENLFKSIDHNRSTSPIELQPMRPSDDGGDTQQQEEEKIDAVLPIDVEKKTQIERIRSCELIELKATFVDKTELLVDLDAVAQVDSELPPSLRGESWRLLYSLVRRVRARSARITLSLLMTRTRYTYISQNAHSYPLLTIKALEYEY